MEARILINTYMEPGWILEAAERSCAEPYRGLEDCEGPSEVRIPYDPAMPCEALERRIKRSGKQADREWYRQGVG